MPIFWTVVASGLGVVLIELGGITYLRWLTLTIKTVFWASAISYFSLRVYSRLSGRR